MRAAPAVLLDPVAPLLQSLRQRAGKLGAVILNRRHGPVENQVERRRQHRQQCEIRPLADVESQRRRPVLVLILHQVGEHLAVAACEPSFFKRDAVVERGSVIGQSDRVGGQQPLVAGADQGVGANLRHIERKRADRLRPVDDQQRAALASPFADADEIEEGAVGPVDLRQRDHRRPGADRLQKTDVPRRRPAAVGPGRRRDHLQRQAALRAQPAPCVDVARKLFFHHHDVVTSRGGDVARHRGQSVGHRRNDGDAVGVGNVDEPRKELSHPRTFVEERRRAEQMRRCASIDASDAGGPDVARKRRHVGAVQIMQPLGQQESGLLAGEHDGDPSARAASIRRAVRGRRKRPASRGRPGRKVDGARMRADLGAGPAAGAPTRGRARCAIGR